MIDDPEDAKPEDWVDIAKIPDPEATKPDDWDESAPREIVDNLNREINAGLIRSTINERLADLGGEAFVRSPADLAKFVTEKAEAWGEVVRAANIKAE